MTIGWRRYFTEANAGNACFDALWQSHWLNSFSLAAQDQSTNLRVCRIGNETGDAGLRVKAGTGRNLPLLHCVYWMLDGTKQPSAHEDDMKHMNLPHVFRPIYAAASYFLPELH
ncbi:hypothetical protein [Hymenobacter pini]|uniref:hypothetical protein n=1 Tax=Hymenobacter pini TaxID=2880879 RepID=UPI001CF49647|nr:hypothetical protein [Hymenobacter pini]MCA8829484.1 hypothetical protein [Hymenobacter pini]